MKEEYRVKSIGEVKAGKSGFLVEIFPQFREALLETTGFSHLQIYWWADQTDTEEMRAMTRVPKPYKKGPEEMGIFATRSPLRPNPLAMTVVPVIQVDNEKGQIHIPFIDAEPGTPVLDLKPYYGMERVKEYQVPQWCRHWPQWYEDAAFFDWAGEFENAR